MNNIQLNFVNNSNDHNNYSVVIFQKNLAQGQQEKAVAWKVISNCGSGDHHPFTFPVQLRINTSDSYGNYTPSLPAIPGDAFNVVQITSGDTLKRSTEPAKVAQEIEVTNSLEKGSINVNCYRDGNLLSTCQNIVPSEMGAFQFKPAIFIGAIPEMVQGEIMNAAVVSEINTEINLTGIASADIVMTGGGSGPESTPFSFTLENVIMA
ncbi:MAG: hypothetical protein A3D31_12795 [Candidatus Fluviicola riflensis]|nr:MAG: hypothetical protein CHH17_17235 [Candidatus Fluviicola riflensis]OGS77861.1 MAG: hypothetical protein A3D31_12795 [Candidatus Fluviicola riflensis]OGS84926.1 MAG: hypothetical protein A2724_09730 [Fluviicola sp. RIFCSPHIGHO2_01_FULL_43_53]OGS89198.1 MAG: hypothetical protein A3E30_04035 [Fluviicola sp. RIFCSPHIGHO2_12_FULL_43_24]